jgi:hypothetical protein
MLVSSLTTSAQKIHAQKKKTPDESTIVTTSRKSAAKQLAGWLRGD